MRSSAVIFAALCVFSVVLGGLVTNLPGAPDVNFKQYAGYFDVGVNNGRHLHYWFVESQNDPTSDPVLVWLMGGPGCSGIAALLTEWGPFLVNDDGETLRSNPYSWNMNANILTLEAPAGVGFSYADNGNVSSSDPQTAEENWEALKAFFAEFPQFRDNEFYVTGESYGGVYVPTLVDAILRKQSEFNINLKGYAIGNGCVSLSLDTDTTIQFTYNHGLVDEAIWQRVNKECCNGAIDGCPFHTFSGSGFCATFVKDATAFVWKSGLNPYDIYEDCLHTGNDGFKQTRYQVDYFNKAGHEMPANLEKVQCIDEHAVTKYVNLPAVRKALYASDKIGKWESCSLAVTTGYKKGTMEMADILKNAYKQGVRGMLYHGDVDMACNYLLGQRFSATLGLPLISNKAEYEVAGQVGGYHTGYDKLDFVTVRGGEHTVAANRPKIAYHIINAFLQSVAP